MIQIADITEYTEADIPRLVEKIKPVLEKRRKLHEKYTREATDSKVMWSDGDMDKLVTKLPFEKFITDLATGYTSGKPTYTVNTSKDEEKNRLIEELLDKTPKDDNYSRGMEVLIEYITNYNDDATENYELIHDIFELTSCYEVIYENEDNEIVSIAVGVGYTGDDTKPTEFDGAIGGSFAYNALEARRAKGRIKYI